MSGIESVLQALRETLGAPSGARSSAAWKGYMAPLGAAQPLFPNRDDWQPWPYRTETAEVVWRHAAQLVVKHPEMDEQQVLQRAVEISGANPLDLSPEDWRLLEMAIEWRKNGIKGVKQPRIGGMPGGPYNSWGMGHELGKRGAP
jgi:hypothetical protein